MTEFQAAVDARDAALLGPLLHPDVVLHPSVRHETFRGRDTTLFVFTMLIELFADCVYTAEYAGPDGLVLLNRGVVGGLQADGVQVLTFDEEGLVTEFRDFVRPLSALQALQDAATAYLSR